MIRNVVFDFGNVLAHVDRREIGESFAAHSPLEPAEILEELFGGELEEKAETGVYDSRQYFAAVKERIDGEESWEYDRFCREYTSALELSKEGVEALHLAAQGGRRVFILSNTSYLHARWLFEQEPLATIPEWHIFSFKVGVMKPDPAIWEYLCRRAGIEPAESLYLDDVEENCRAAGELGFQTLHHRPGLTDLPRELARLL